MKLIFEDNDMIIFLNKCKLDNFSDKTPEKFLKELIHCLKEKYKINIYGYYNVTLYIDKYFGNIIKLEKEDLEYFDYFGNNVELNINVVNEEFVYKLEEMLDLNLIKKFTVYKYKDTFYLKPKENISNIEFGILMEKSKIIFEPSFLKIINCSKILKG